MCVAKSDSSANYLRREFDGCCGAHFMCDATVVGFALEMTCAGNSRSVHAFEVCEADQRVRGDLKWQICH